MKLYSDLRPCLIDKGSTKALFHEWNHRSWIVPPSPLQGGHNGGIIGWDFAIVELAAGSIREVEPSEVRFVANKALFEERFKDTGTAKEKICPRCNNTKIRHNADFCWVCGKMLNEEE